MDKKVAVEDCLDDVKKAFESEGFCVDSYDDSKISSIDTNKYDAIIISGISQNFLGDETTSTKSPIINADGLTTDKIIDMVLHK